MWSILRAVLFLLPAETAHHLAMAGLKLWARFARARIPERDPITLWGQRYANRFGIAAGFDKGDVVAKALFGLGFGFVEIGTITPRPQPGNPRPRLFRLKAAGGLVNRMGFNNLGAEAVAAKLRKLGPRPGPVWINIGKNKDTPNERAVDDYVIAMRVLQPHGDVFVVNVSSPNTPGLRDLQAESALRPLLTQVLVEAKGKPVLLKLAPDLADDALPGLVKLAREVGLAGLVATNTTIARPVPSSEAGGLSGAPLRARANDVMKILHREDDQLVLVGVGGVMNAEDFAERRAAGATLVQGYTGFIYGGPGWVKKVLRRARE